MFTVRLSGGRVSGSVIKATNGPLAGVWAATSGSAITPVGAAVTCGAAVVAWVGVDVAPASTGAALAGWLAGSGAAALDLLHPPRARARIKIKFNSSIVVFL